MKHNQWCFCFYWLIWRSLSTISLISVIDTPLSSQNIHKSSSQNDCFFYYRTENGVLGNALKDGMFIWMWLFTQTVVWHYCEIPISQTLLFPNLPINWTKFMSFSSVKQCNLTPNFLSYPFCEPIFFFLRGLKNRDSTLIVTSLKMVIQNFTCSGL